MSLLRAIEQHQPQQLRIINDPLAAAFLQHRLFRLIVASPMLSRLVSRFLNRWAPGGQEFLTIRPRLVDDLAAELVAEGLDQIVILGAGFDTMAWRIVEDLRGVSVFEVDHPATQEVKRKVSERISKPDNLHFVAVDFEADDFVEKLRGADFDRTRRTLVVWVGVTYYLTAQAMARAMAESACLGGAGMRLVFDYLLEEVVDGTTRDRDALGKARRAAQLGEPWLFGLRPEQVGDYLATFGFRLLKDYEPAELRARYCPLRATPMKYVRIAMCERL